MGDFFILGLTKAFFFVFFFLGLEGKPKVCLVFGRVFVGFLWFSMVFCESLEDGRAFRCPFWRVFGRFLEVFGGFWRFLEVFEGFWRVFGRFLEVFGRFFGGFWKVFGRFLEVFGRFLEVFGRFLEGFWRFLKVFGGF